MDSKDTPNIKQISNYNCQSSKVKKYLLNFVV